jgi:DNA end-binding protein Ku
VPPRANWKGYLKLSLVTCPVALFPAASDKEKVSFHLLNGETGHRLKQQYVDSETGEIVDRENRVKGYEVGKGDYVTVSDEELAAIEIESSHTIDIESFVPKSDVDPVYFDNRYFIAPDDKIGQEAFAVIREAMRQRGVAGIARVALHGRERLILLEPRAKGIMGTTLHHNYEVRSDSAPTSLTFQTSISARNYWNSRLTSSKLKKPVSIRRNSRIAIRKLWSTSFTQGARGSQCRLHMCRDRAT